MRVPLLVLSADRPPWLRDVGANQVVDQRTLFGSTLRFFHEFAVPQRVPGQNAGWRAMVCRAVGAATAPARLAGPVQLNLLALARTHCMPDGALPTRTDRRRPAGQRPA